MKKIIIYIISLIFLFSCENGLIGLGEKIDIEIPQLTIGRYADGTIIANADYVRGTITLTGTVQDDIGVSAVNLTIVDTVTLATSTGSANINYSAMTWSYVIDTTSFIDGEKDITIKVLDTSSSPKSSTIERMLYFDNTAPILRVKSYDGYTNLNSVPNLISDSRTWISGEAYDTLKVKQVSVSLISGSVTMADVKGIENWSVELKNIVTGNTTYQIIAEDYAGNTSSYIYHESDIRSIIGGDEISLDNLFSIESGMILPDYSITSADLLSIQLSSLSLDADMNEDVPVITISNPEIGATLGGNAIVIGRVEDDDEVEISSISINIDNGGWFAIDGLPETEISGSGQVVNFKYDISSLTNGSHTVQIKAEDDHGTLKVSDLVTFTVDLGAPQVSITSPVQGFYSNNSSVTILGTSYDDQSVSSVKVQIDGEAEIDWRNASTSNAYADWTYNTPALSEGVHNIKVYAKDGTGKVSSYNISFYIDITYPTVNFSYPVKNSQVYGDITLQGNCEDNYNSFSSRYIKIGKDGSWVEITGVSNWTYSLTDVENTYNNTSSSNDLGGGLWQLPVTFKATDVAGNETETIEADYSFVINATLDNPEVSISYPDSGFKTGGPVTIRGTAYDEQQIQRVEMRLDLNGDGDFDDQFILDGDGNTTDDFEDETVWVQVSGLGELNWQQKLNTAGELFGLSAGGVVNIEVRAVDTKDSGVSDGVTGDIESMSITFDNSYPYFDNFSHSSFDYESGTFILECDAHDSEYVDSILISYNGGTSYTDITSSSTKISDQEYEVSLAIDSTVYISDSGILPIKLKVIDNASNSTDIAINLNIDNIIPEATWTGVLDDVNGTAFKVQGTATDSGTVSGIDKIEVYFVRSGNVYNPGSVNTTIPIGSFDFNDGNGSVPYTGDSAYKITINDTNEFGSDLGGNGDLDGFNESLTLSGSTYSWWAEFDSNNIPDGLLDVYYVVHDMAGNAQHFSESFFIKNNKPTIVSTTVGVDLDYSDVVEAAEQFSYTASFNSQNRLYIDLNVSDDNALTYAIYHGTDNSGTLLDTTSNVTIDISGYSDGSHSFYCEITDSTGIIISKLIETVIDNTDATPPTISIDTLEQTHVTDGHLETASNSIYDNSDADVSGILTLTGNAWDNQRIKSITLTLDGLGTDVPMAAWEGNTLVSKNTNFTIDSYSISEYSGLLITWSFEWDTSTISTIAANNVLFSMNIEDYGSPTNSDSDDVQVDVVPYITDIDTGLENGTLSYIKRSALGYYPISYSNSETMTIRGFNLYPDPDTVAYPTDLVEVGSGSVTIISRDSTNNNFVEVRKDSTVSGYLSVTTHGISSINNINDNAVNSEASEYRPLINDDRYMYLWELESKGTWTGMTEAIMRPEYSVSGSTESTDMSWLYVNNGQEVLLNGIELTSSWSLLGGDFHYNDDGTPMYIFSHNMNWYGGLSGYQYYGSVQWGKDESTEADAYNWHRSSTDRLGIGNLSFNGDGNYAYNNVVMDRYHNLQIVTDGTDADTDNYVAYYDTASESTGLVLFAFKTGDSLAAGDQVTAMSGSWYSNMTKYTPASNTNYPAGSYNVGLRTPYNSDGFTGTRIELTSGGNDSEHFDIAWDDGNGNLYLAYYDGSSSELKFMYNTDPENDASTWTTRSTELDTGAGLYLDMAVDPLGGIHISYYDAANSNLKYAYLPSYDCADAVVETYTVDSLFTNGMYTSIAIKDFDETVSTDYRPVISHYSLSFSGTKYALRAAWPVYALGDALFDNGAEIASGDYTGKWEVCSVISSTAASAENGYMTINSTRDTSEDISRRTEGQIVIGYNGSYIEEAKLLDE